MKILRVLGILLGVGLVVLLLHEVGWQSVQHTLALLGWSYIIVLSYPAIWFFFNTLGWRYAMLPGYPLSFRTLVGIRLAGETFNSLLPSSYVGGEPVKAKLVSRWIPLREAASSVLIAKSAQSMGLLLFIGFGLVVGLPITATASQRTKVWIALGLLTIGVSIFTWLLAQQSFSLMGRIIYQFTHWAWLKAQEVRLQGLDDSLGKFYRNHKMRFLKSVVLHGVGWMAGMFELVVIFALMGTPISWKDAWFMGALAQLGSVIGLISPAGIGFYEGGHYMAAVLLGLPPSLGISASLIRRVREVFWDIIGLYFFNKYSNTET